MTFGSIIDLFSEFSFSKLWRMHLGNGREFPPLAVAAGFSPAVLENISRNLKVAAT